MMNSIEKVRSGLRFLADNPSKRLVIYAVLAVVTGLLIFFPRPWTARAQIVPQDTSASAASTTTLLGALGGNAQGIGSLLTGGRPSNDLYLIIGRSDSVTEDAIKSLKLVGPDAEYPTMRAAKLALAKKVDVHMLLGGVLEIETKTHSPKESIAITVAYQNAVGRQLASFGKQIIVNKRRIVTRRFNNAATRVAKAEAKLAAFRRENNLAAPEQQFGSVLSQRTALEAQLQAKLLELQTMQQFRGPESQELAALQSEIAGLRRDIAKSTVPQLTATGPNVAGLSNIITRYLDLYREYRVQQAIYDVYQRSFEQVEVEELAAESASYIQIIDAAHLDATRQINNWGVALFGLVLLLSIFTEWYGPATGLFTRHGFLMRPKKPNEG
ncbi:capsule biosynthesis protein [Novosphingobium sp. APW14]|uniref:capsule biosynthesis protein n=1 Tax=Novosphingobium sp. APW14 TaxID=3077237 RepID=UPI0028DEC329|nr:capsule biosynthesis protein [Novosphingobium sp. APW14]MDT9013638.1 capsule biosynthesis protein [Novosphingobium sp. APW14]